MRRQNFSRLIIENPQVRIFTLNEVDSATRRLKEENCPLGF